ncbi:MAG: ATP-binding protein [Alphaproteobacteria bacterium]|nr:ATP-binding protein [Alphaproteobacteria bacterium]
MPLTIFKTKSNLFAQIITRLLGGIILFAILQISFVLYTYLNNIQDLGQSLLTRQSQEIAKSIHLKGEYLSHDKKHNIHEHISDARIAFAVYSKAGQEIMIHGPYDLRDSLMPPVTSVSAETRRDEYSNGFRLKGIRKVIIDNHPIWVSIVIEGKGLRPFTPVLITEIVEHVALPIIPLSLFILVFNIIVVRKTLLPVTNAIEQIDKIRPDDIGFRLDTPESPVEVQKLVIAMNNALERIESAVTSLRHFTADTAHELRTPLAIMRLEVDKLPEGENKLKLINDLEGMTRLVSQMLDMAYANALVIQNDSQANLGNIARDVINQLTPLAVKSRKSITLNDLSDGIPIYGHAEALGRALRNTIENAIFYTPEGTSVEVTVINDRKISVRDHGAGISEDQQKTILNRFSRGSKKSTHQGAGLGLAIALQIAKSHGGTIEFSPSSEQGCTVILNLGKIIPNA